ASEDQLHLRRLSGRARSLCKAAQALAGVVGKIGLAEFAVVNAVETRLQLLPHNLGDGTAQPPRQGCLIVGLTATLSGDHLSQIGWPGQAAGMGGQDPVGAALHGLPPSGARYE